MYQTQAANQAQSQSPSLYIKNILNKFIDSFYDFHFDFTCQTKERMTDLPTLKSQLKEALGCLEDSDEFTILLYKLLTQEHTNIADDLEKLEDFLKDSDDTGIDEDSVYYEYASFGTEADLYFPHDPSPPGKVLKQRLADFVLAYLLNKITLDRMSGEDNSHPQNFRHILSYFSEKQPEFLLIFDSMIMIIFGKDKFAIQERGRASRTLINNYRVEELFIHISTNRRIPEEEKSFIFSWLLAYQKLYRKILEVLYDKKAVKEKIARVWFKKSGDKNGCIEGGIDADCKIPKYVRMFIDHVIRNEEKEAVELGRHLVYSVNNEDVLRIMCGLIHEDCDILGSQEWMTKVYRVIYDIICDYRRQCTELSHAHPKLKTTFSEISKERRISETIITPSHKKEDRTPILGQKRSYDLIEETRKNLEESNLKHLFEVWPLPELSQRLFNQICLLKHMIPQDEGHIIQHYLYREKVLEFLMQLDRVGIEIVKDSYLPLLTNAYQLDSMGLIKERLYLGSTGHWKTPNQKPPSLLCCTNPHSIGNCHGHLLRHIVMRVFLGTGEFYESPFVLDSTLRYGQMDEDGGVDALIMRPGLFMVKIPDKIKKHWEAIQLHQMKGKLGKLVAEKIRRENSI